EDRARALRLLDEAGVGLLGRDALVRAALGSPPPADALAKLEYSGFTDSCDVSLEPWSAQYTAVLPTLRGDVRKHCFPLAFVHDESVVPDLARWLEEAITGSKRPDMRWPSAALRMIGGKSALEA